MRYTTKKMESVKGLIYHFTFQQSGKMGTQIQATDDTDLKTLERALRKDEEQMSKVSEKKQDLEQRLYASRYVH